MPALYRLAYERRLPATVSIVGSARSPMSDEEFRSKMHDAVKEFLEDSPFDEERWAPFARNLFYVPGDFKDPQLYNALKNKIEEIGHGNVLFYLSTQPSYYG